MSVHALQRVNSFRTSVRATLRLQLVRALSVSCDALLVKAGDDLRVTRLRLPFEFTARQARQVFLNWAEVHELPIQPIDWQATVTQSVQAGETETVRTQDFDGPQPVLLPFWCFTGPKRELLTIYAGTVFDATVVQSTVANGLDRGGVLSDAIIMTVEEESMPHTAPIGKSGTEMSVRIEKPDVHVAPAWGMLQAMDAAAAEISLHRLQAAHLLLLPGYAFSYRYLGMPMVAWACGRTGEVGGVSHRAPWADIVPKGSAALEKASQTLLGIERHLPGSAQATLDLAVRAAGAAAIVARRHPKVAIGMLAAPVAYKLLRPVAETMYSKAQMEWQRAREEGHRHSAEGSRLSLGGLSAEEAAWDWLLRRGPPVPPTPAEMEAEEARNSEREAAAIDWDDPVSILGLSDQRATTANVERAFRNRMLKWHPDRAQRCAHGEEVISQAEAQRRTVALVKAYQELKARAGQF